MFFIGIKTSLDRGTITFEVKSKVIQDLEILKEGVTVEDIVEGLKNSRYFTTIEHGVPLNEHGVDDGNRASYVVGYDPQRIPELIAIITQQEIDVDFDTSYDEFEVV